MNFMFFFFNWDKSKKYTKLASPGQVVVRLVILCCLNSGFSRWPDKSLPISSFEWISLTPTRSSPLFPNMTSLYLSSNDGVRDYISIEVFFFFFFFLESKATTDRFRIMTSTDIFIPEGRWESLGRENLLNDHHDCSESSRSLRQSKEERYKVNFEVPGLILLLLTLWT